MKINKESFQKNGFWMLLGAFVPVWLIALIWLSAGASGEIQDKEKELKDALDSLAKPEITSPKGQKFIEALAEREKRLKPLKEKLWEEGWKGRAEAEGQKAIQGQEDMWGPWPNSDIAKLQANAKDKPFGADIGTANDLKEYRDTLYLTQLEDKAGKPVGVAQEMIALIQPAYFKGGWKSVIRPIEKAKDAAAAAKATAGSGLVWKADPTSEECWYAQEDLWVKRELLRSLKDAVDAVARFKRFKPEKPEPQHFYFKNADWELDLLLATDKDGKTSISGKSKIKNINPTGRTLSLAGVNFVVQQKANRSKPFTVPVEPLAYGRSAEITDAVPLESIKAEDFDVEQVYLWHTAPIRRVDAVDLGKHSHRTANLIPVARKEPGAPANAQPAAKDAKPADAKEGLTPNNEFDRRRYVKATDEVRHMAVGLVLIVDQTYIQDVLAALANSRLRFQTTQVGWRHVQKIAPPTAGEPAAAPPAAAARAAPAAQDKPKATGPDDPNLVELTVYGIIALYERFEKPNATAKKEP